MKGYWIKFSDGSSGYCQGYSKKDAEKIAEKVSGKKVAGESEPLPYPANPVIWQFEHPIDGVCPAFCYSPEKCKGNTACPCDYSCIEWPPQGTREGHMTQPIESEHLAGDKSEPTNQAKGVSSFIAYTSNPTPANACRLAADDLRNGYPVGFIDSLHDAARLLDRMDELESALKQLIDDCNGLDSKGNAMVRDIHGDPIKKARASAGY